MSVVHHIQSTGKLSTVETTYFFRKKSPCPRRECLRAEAKIVNTVISLTDLRKRCLLWKLRNFGENSLSNRGEARAEVSFRNEKRTRTAF